MAVRKNRKAGVYTRLFVLRTRSNLSQKALAKVSGVSNKTIVDIERGKSWPTPETIEKLSKALSIPTEEFFTDDPREADGKEDEEAIQTV
jgi:transcriptional regulator with XRE-family HTH domain